MKLERRFSILDHPADLGVEAEGSTLAEAFAAAAEGLMSVIVDLSTVEPRAERKVRITGADIQQLLVRWLSEVLYLYDGEQFVGGQFDPTVIGENVLEATIRGEQVDRTRHRMRVDVKAVTYHQLLIEQGNSGARVRVYFDI